MTIRLDAEHAVYLARRGCSSKARYLTKGRAKAFALQIRARMGKHLKPYHCRWCDQWHLTTKGPR